MKPILAPLSTQLAFVAIRLTIDTPEGPMHIHTWTTGPDSVTALMKWRLGFRWSGPFESKILTKPRVRRMSFPSDYIPIGARVA